MNLLNANSYEKGGFVLHMLRLELGDDIFFEGIRSYYDQYKGGNATTQQFQAMMEEVSGKKLDWFFDQWVFQAGYPQLKATWTYADGKLQVKMRQLQPVGTRWNVPVELGIKLEGEAELRYITIRSDKRTVEETFDIPSAPKELIWDPRINLLAEGVVMPE